MGNKNQYQDKYKVLESLFLSIVIFSILLFGGSFLRP